MTAGFLGSRFAPIISGVNSRAYTSAPSRALYVMTLGSIHLKASHSSVGVEVTFVGDAPGWKGMRYSSGGLVVYEYTIASVFPSGDTVASFDPVTVVTRVIAPPSTDIV